MESPTTDKHLIINAAECDPGLIHDKWLLTHAHKELMNGIEILQKCISFNSVTVAAKNFYGIRLPASVKLHRVADFYPAGAEKILVKDVLKIELPEKIPASNGILILNIQTVIALYEAVFYDQKADTRFLTVADLEHRTGQVVRVNLGDSVYDTVQKLLPGSVNVYIGGGSMNARLADDSAVINDKTNFLAIGQIKGFREALCSGCNLCSVYCPAALRVREIAHLVDAGKPKRASLLHPDNCMECGLCSTVCLAGRDQAGRVKAAKYHRRTS
jgi:Na+-translocating ferredoxin:NAD+ oxidoreductase RnfC subunit